MSATEEEQEWLDGMSPADDWDARATKRVLSPGPGALVLFKTANPFTKAPRP